VIDAALLRTRRTPNYWGLSRILCSFPGELLHRECDTGADAEHMASFSAIGRLHGPYLLRL